MLLVDNPCRKCGGRRLSQKWEAMRDMMHILCVECGFSWYVPPLDNEGVPKRILPSVGEDSIE